MVSVLDCDIVLSQFEFHSRDYIHFRTWISYEHDYPPSQLWIKKHHFGIKYQTPLDHHSDQTISQGNGKVTWQS